MRPVERTILWCGVIALAIFALVLNGRVNDLQATTQDHTAALNKPRLEAAVFPGVPAAFTERWSKATTGKEIPPQDHLWLTIQLTNAGQSFVREPVVKLSLVPAISAIYPYSEWSWNTPQVTEGGQGKTQVQVAFPSLSQSDSHTVFIAMQPEGFDGPPYDAQDKRQWADNYRLYWKTLTVTAEEGMTQTQYGLASDWIAATQQVAKQ